MVQDNSAPLPPPPEPPKAPKKRGQRLSASDRRGIPTPPLIKLRARNLYLHHGLNATDISKRIWLEQKTALQPSLISRWASDEHWVDERKKLTSIALQREQENASQYAAEALKAISDDALELCSKALDVTRAGLTQGDLEGAKQAQAASTTLKNLSGVARLAHMAGEIGTGSVSVNLFFAPTEAKADPVVVTEVEAKQVS